MLAGPIAGVLLDRLDRKRVDDRQRPGPRRCSRWASSFRCGPRGTWLLYVLSALLMFASPFFTSGRAVDPARSSRARRTAHRQLADADHAVDHGDASGSFLGGASAHGFRLRVRVRVQCAVVSCSRRCASRGCACRRAPASGRRRNDVTEDRVVRPWHEYRRGSALHALTPLILGDRRWSASAGPPAAARRRFCSACSASMVFNRGAAGIGEIWGCAGIGLIVGGVAGATRWGKRLSFDGLQADRGGLLHRARRRVRGLQPDAPVTDWRCSSSRCRARRWR